MVIVDEKLTLEKFDLGGVANLGCDGRGDGCRSSPMTVAAQSNQDLFCRTHIVTNRSISLESHECDR